MDKGNIVEYDTPKKLMEKEGGVFREMCLSTGQFKELQEAIGSD